MGIVSREEAVLIRSQARLSGKRVGFTSGIFDLLHKGHLEYLEWARSQCDILFVAVNSDSSTTRRKGFTRPIISQDSRVALIAGLRCVDVAFVFDEDTNRTNISELEPDVYCKAGDYSSASLSSAPIVESYGGEVLIAPFLPGYSTSTIIDKIQGRIGVDALPSPSKSRRPAAFIDRDGTLVELVEYLHEPKKVRLLPGVGEGLQELQKAGFFLVIVTNQPGIGIGYFSKEDFFATNRELLKQASAFKVTIDKIYVSPYSKSDNTTCRKPNTGLIERALTELPIDRENSVFIGDMTGDIQCGKNANIKAILLATGRGGKDGEFSVTPDGEAPSFLDAAILAKTWLKKASNVE
jgi:rfaE bifunctional protein nucleotidyltransferase chain/domain